ncbi:unnamed protein product, partial [Mesorhabditis spiculigera]
MGPIPLIFTFLLLVGYAVCAVGPRHIPAISRFQYERTRPSRYPMSPRFLPEGDWRQSTYSGYRPQYGRYQLAPMARP